jgi:protein PET117
MRGAAVLAAVAAITAAGVAYVHWAQTAEREGMHAGVLRDEARLAARLREKKGEEGVGAR